MFLADAAGGDLVANQDEGFFLVVAGAVLDEEGGFGITLLGGLAALPFDFGPGLGEMTVEAQDLAIGEREVGGELVGGDGGVLGVAHEPDAGGETFARGMG